ncbi:MAG: HAMP domain-containing sensor histidine kinase, partial [Betaproteobacteria bacterium]
AHEIRNPLNTIKTAMHGIATLSTAATKPFIDPIQRQINFMVRLVEDLQEVSRANAYKVTLRKERVVLQDLLHRVADGARPHAEHRGQSFQVLLIPAPLTVDVDPERIVQVLINLLENAIKYTPAGGTIWLKCTIEEQEAVIGVEDSGIGIEKDVLPYIFELFTQEQSSRPASQGGLGAGLGLGLPLVKELVALHGGTIQVISPGKNQGSQFTVRLPSAKE